MEHMNHEERTIKKPTRKEFRKFIGRGNRLKTSSALRGQQEGKKFSRKKYETTRVKKTKVEFGIPYEGARPSFGPEPPPTIITKPTYKTYKKFIAAGGMHGKLRGTYKKYSVPKKIALPKF